MVVVGKKDEERIIEIENWNLNPLWAAELGK